MYMIATQNINNTLISTPRLNSSSITYSLCLLRAPVINSETKEANQTKRCIGKQRDINTDQFFFEKMV